MNANTDILRQSTQLIHAHHQMLLYCPLEIFSYKDFIDDFISQESRNMLGERLMIEAANHFSGMMLVLQYGEKK